MPLVNLVFQGGGVKGICYAGALLEMPKEIQPHIVGGSSAGAIAAAFVAVGYRGDDLVKALSSLDIAALLGPDGVAQLKRLDELKAEFAAAFAKTGIRRTASLVGFATRRMGTVIDLCDRMERDLGLFASDQLRAWLVTHLGEIRMNQIKKVEDLRILASNVSKGSFELFSKNDNGDTPVATAVTASASIPLFFKPTDMFGNVLVDGGMLSNFPLHLFERETYGTVGFRIGAVSQPAPQSRRLVRHAGALLTTMMDAHDKMRAYPHRYHEEIITMPPNIGTFSFGLSDQQKQFLILLGQAAGKAVPWSSISSNAPMFAGLDRDPDTVLDKTVAQGVVLEDYLMTAENQPEEMECEVSMEATLLPDGDCEYSVVSKVLVRGATPLLGTTSGVSFDDPLIDCTKLSLADFQFKMEEDVGGKRFCVPTFPKQIETKNRGFVHVFTPPVVEGQDQRIFEKSWRIPQEYHQVTAEKPVKLNFSMMRRAKSHFANYKITLYAPTKLNLVAKAEGADQGLMKGPEEVSKKGVSYHKWVWERVELVAIDSILAFEAKATPAG